jgi:hypothetical protein
MMKCQKGKWKCCDVKFLRNRENYEDAVYDDRYTVRSSNTKLECHCTLFQFKVLYQYEYGRA